MPIRLLLASLLLLVSGCGSGPAEPPAPKQAVVVSESRQGRLVELEIDSPALGRTAQVEVLLPEGWRPGGGWPVLYLLEGCCGSGGPGWVSEGGADEITEDAGVIVVIPEGGYAGFYSDWLNGPKWETFHLTEVRTLIEGKYGASDRRAVAGLSMGGFGALSYAARHPGMFQAAASFSGLVDVSDQDVRHIVGQTPDDPADLWGPDSARVAEHNPTALVSRLKDIPVYVSCGDGTPGPFDAKGAGRDDGERFILNENRAFIAAARKAGVKVTANLYGPGRHSWPYWSRELRAALPMLVKAIS